MRHFLAIVATAGLLSACGGGDDNDGGNNGGSTSTVHCLFTGDLCEAITGSMTTAQKTSLQSSCTGGEGTYGEGGCPTAGAVAGHCRYTGEAVTAMTGVPIAGAVADEYYYTAGGWDVGAAQSWCGTPPAGTWVP